MDNISVLHRTTLKRETALYNSNLYCTYNIGAINHPRFKFPISKLGRFEG